MKLLNKNIMREFKSSLPRFISISALLTLAIFVLVGLNATGPDMRDTAQKAYTTENLADAIVTSPIYFDKTDQIQIKSLSNTKNIVFGNTTDAIIKNSKKVIRIQNNPHILSKMTITKGHKAKNADQIVLSSNLANNYKIGNKINLVTDKTNTATNLMKHSYKIVGFATSTEFIKKDNIGTTNLGNGQLAGFAYVTKSAFTNTMPNIAKISFIKTKGKAYSKEYEHYAKIQTNKWQKTLNTYNTKRYSKLRKDIDNKITDGQNKIYANTNTLNNAKQQLDNAQSNLNIALKQAQATNNTAAIAQIRQQQETLNTKKTDLAKKQTAITDAKANITNAKSNLKSLNTAADLTVESRNNYNDGYNNYGEDASRIDAIGTSFPLFFFLIAILVSFTTMQRMVEEKRIEIGTLRALGYTKFEAMREFLLYSLAEAIIGTIIGSILGLVILPRIIFRAYTANFNLGKLLLAPHPVYVTIGFILALFSTVLASWLAARSELKIDPAELMLPKPPANGSRILLERIKPIWQHMNFSHKVTARNLFRYKGRMIMTIIGVAGATALMITGFGVRDSLNTIVQRQFGNIDKYDLIAIYNPNAPQNQVNKAKKFITNPKFVNQDTSIYFNKVYAANNKSNTRENISLIVPNNANKLNQFIKLSNTKTDKKIKLSNNGAVISQKLAKIQNVRVGDTLKVEDAVGNSHKIKVNAITTMYAGHYIYMNRHYYTKVYNKSIIDNAYLITLKNRKSSNKFAEDFNHNQAALQTIQSTETKKTITNILSNLNNLIIVIVLAATLLSLVVLYTLTNINVSERIRELSTLKVLGFYPNEVLMYIFREVNILTGGGIIVGIGIGYAFHAYIMNILPPSTAMVAPGITWVNIGLSVSLTIIFLLIVMSMMNKKIQNVNMLEALKSVD